MGLINQDIKNLVSGISQQPPTLRHPEQLEEQLNGFSSEASGLQKRPPSVFISTLAKPKGENKPLVHFIDRDNIEQYVVIFDGNGIDVFDIKGNKKTVQYESEEVKSYLFTEQPRYSLKVISIADYTFVANTNVVTKMEDKPKTSLWDTQGYLVNIKSGQYGRTYKIEDNGVVVATYETPDGSDKSHSKQIATDYIVDQLASQLTSKGYTVEKGSSWLYMNKTELRDESGRPPVIIQPSTTIKQQADRFKSLATAYYPHHHVDKPSSQGGKVYEKVEIVGDTIVLKGIDDTATYPPTSSTNYHFLPDSMIVAELERCRKDHWKIEETKINEVVGQGWVFPRLYYTRQYVLTPIIETIPDPNSRLVTTIKNPKVYDGFNNQAAFGTFRAIQKFANLPVSAPADFTCKIAGAEGETTDDYYVRYDATERVWKETVRPALANNYVKATMPHALIRQADGTFLFKELDWTPRRAGDETSNPEPSFIGNTINDVFYHRNRLGFLSGENVILTQSADFFNFWIQSAVKIQDTDSIDLAVSDNTISTLHHAVASDAELIVFSDKAQFALTSQNVLTPKDAVLTPALTHFETSLKAKPVNAGRNIYFVAERAEYSTVREFFTAQDNTEAKDAQDITSHCPNYIPNGVYKIVTSTVENIMFYLTEGDKGAMYVYKYLFIDGQRVQAAWSKWDFGTEILGGEFINSDLYLVIVRRGIMCLEKISFTFETKDFDEEPYRVLLDSKKVYEIPADAYDADMDKTIIDCKKVFGDLYNPEAAYSGVSTDKAYDTTIGDSLLYMNGDYRGQKLIVGLNYIFRILMSPILVKQDEGGRTHALTEGRLQLKRFWFNYADTGFFTVTVSHKTKGTSYTYMKTTKDIGTLNAVVGDYKTSTGLFRFPVLGNAEDINIKLASNTPLPVALVGAGWIGNYQRKTRYF